jgi:hypothetical protein
MLRRDVQRVEIIPIRVDPWPFRDRKSHIRKDRRDLFDLVKSNPILLEETAAGLDRIAASLPPMLVAWVDPEMSTWGTLAVAGGLMLINGLIGSLLDPRYVGHAVKLSPLVVFFSMLVELLNMRRNKKVKAE